jgi:aminopeptidase
VKNAAALAHSPYDRARDRPPRQGVRPPARRPVDRRAARRPEIRIVGEDTDLTLSLTGRAGAIDDGHANVPGGEVYYSPVEDSAEGTVRFDFRSGRVEGARLLFRAGEVVEATADAGKEVLLQALETDAGARRLGELGLGCNEGITRHLHNVLFDEKMAGTIHLALGAGFPRVGGRNESALHWDLVNDMRRDGRLYCDGELVQQDDSWLL